MLVMVICAKHRLFHLTMVLPFGIPVGRLTVSKLFCSSQLVSSKCPAISEREIVVTVGNARRRDRFSIDLVRALLTHRVTKQAELKWLSLEKTTDDDDDGHKLV
jgi:hypothetical protein